MRPEKYEAGQDPIANALERASKHDSSVTLGPTSGDVRFDFADAVVAEMIGFDLNTDEGREEFAQLTTALRKSHWALGEFIRLAVEKHLADLPSGTVVRPRRAHAYRAYASRVTEPDRTQITFRGGDSRVVRGRPDEIASQVEQYKGRAVRLTTINDTALIVNWENVLFLEPSYPPAAA